MGLAWGGVVLGMVLAAGCVGPSQPAPSQPVLGGKAPGVLPAEVARINPPAAAGSLAPNLSRVGGDLILSWLEPVADESHRLLVSRFDGTSWGEPAVVSEGRGFFANWADLPAVGESGDGSLVAHWLAKTAEDTYAYSIFLARSADGGATWTELGRLNDDETHTEHGFVSYAPEGEALRAFWLDGREMPGGGAMGLRTALIGDTIGASELLDSRVCECCSTDAASGAGGPLVVYRDRSDDEIRDTSIVRRAAGDWTAPATAVSDGWTIAGCPVNGPAVAADGERVALAWFTAAGEAPRVQLAFSTDGGATFDEAMTIDADAPAGRVDVVLDGNGGAVFGWLAVADEVGSVRLLRASADGMGEPFEVAVTGAGRSSGFPRLARLGRTVYVAWVDTTPESGQRILAAAVPIDGLAIDEPPPPG